MKTLQTRAALAAVAIGVTGVIPVLTATPALAACPTGVSYGVTSTPRHVPFGGLPTFKNGPAGRNTFITVSRSYSGSASYSVVAGAETEVGAVLAKAKVTISASLTQTNSTSTTLQFSSQITPGKYGNAQYVSWGNRVVWKKYRNNANCTATYLSGGTIDFPSNSEGWRYWET